MSKRAERRHHYQRLKRKRRRYWGDHGEHEWPMTERERAQRLGVKVSAPKPQSNCMCCMNQRKVEGDTRQERRAAMKQKEALGL